MTQFLRDEASDSEEVLTPLMLDGTYLSRNFATLGPFLTLQPPCVSERFISCYRWKDFIFIIVTFPLSCRVSSLARNLIVASMRFYGLFFVCRILVWKGD